MRPALAPVGNDRPDAHDFPENKKPKHMTSRAVWGKASAEPRAEDRDDDKESRAGEQSGVRWDMAFDVIAGKETGKQRIC